MSKFGWSLPPGCTQRHIDEAAGGDAQCELCGLEAGACECPECPVCGEHGNPNCYEDLWQPGKPPDHGGQLNNKQEIARARMRIDNLRRQIIDEEQFIEYIMKGRES